MPSNFVMKKWFTFKPSLWLAFITTGWGVIMTLHGVVQNYGGIVAVRLLMGIFEAGFFPGAVAYMNTHEGIFTVLVGAILPWVLSDTPDSRPKSLSPEEADYLISHMTEQNGGQSAKAATSHLNKSLFWTVISDWQYYPLAVVQWSNTVPTYSLRFTLPQIVKNMGFTSSNAQLLSIPPCTTGAISSISFNTMSDRFRCRSYFVIIAQTSLVVTYALLTTYSPHSKIHIPFCYFAIVLANIECYPINPGGSSWCSNNTASQAKRSIGIAYLTPLSSIGGIFASYIYKDSEAPGYPTGFGTSLVFATAGIVAVIGLDLLYVPISKKRDEFDEHEIRKKYTDDELIALGDKSPLFRYTLRACCNGAILDIPNQISSQTDIFLQSNPELSGRTRAQ